MRARLNLARFQYENFFKKSKAIKGFFISGDFKGTIEENGG